MSEDLNIGDALRAGWDMTKAHFLRLLGLYILVFALLGGILVGIAVLAAVNEALASALGSVVNLVASLLLQSGSIAVALKICDGRRPSLEDFVCEGRVLGYFFVEMLLLGTIVAVGFLLFIVPGVYLFLRLGWSYYFIVDQRLDPIEALKRSWEATEGLAGPVFVYYLACVGIVLGGFLLIVIGSIPAWFVTSLASAFLYRSLAKRLPSPTGPRIL